MRKLYFIAMLLFCTSCSSNNVENNFDGHMGQLNGWSRRASLQELCSSMELYRKDKVVLDRILLEFRNRNMSYLYCDSYYIKS